MRNKEPEVTDYSYFTSALGNAFFSGMGITQLWSCVQESNSAQEFDAAVSATLALNNIVQNQHK